MRTVPDGRISNKRALVTGSSSGIGAAIARSLAQRGANLVLVARRKERLEALAEELRGLGVEVLVHAADLTRPDAPDQIFEATEGADLPIDILVNNAGVGDYDPFIATPWASVERQIQLNAVAVTKMCHLFAPTMVERGAGQIMNVASIGAYTPTPLFAVYTSTKAYVRHLSEALDYELRGTGVRTICVNPGGTKSEFTAHSGQSVNAVGDRLMMTSERCAEIAVEKMLAGRRNVITGWMNAIGMWLLRFMPRSTYPALAHGTMSRAVDKV